MKVNWSDEAECDLNEIVDFITKDNPVAALNLAELLFETAEKIGQMPYMGRNGRVAGTREKIVHPNYLLVYQVLSDAIRIQALVHTRTNYLD